MNDTDLTPIRRRPDGSIDSAHYIDKAHVLRAKQARALSRAVARKPLFSKLWKRLSRSAAESGIHP